MNYNRNMDAFFKFIAFLMCLLSRCVSTNVDNKRLVLHSDIDLTKEVMALKAEVLAMKSNLNAKNQEISNIRDNLTLLQAEVDAKDRDISNIRSNFTRQLQEETFKRMAETTANSQSIAQVQKTLKDGFASTYVRWGKRDCGGNSSQTVYTGYTGGSHYNEEGNAANFVCLPEQPTWAHYLDGVQNIGGHMYGTEYNNHLRSSFNPFNMGPLDQDDAPCAVCRAPYATTIMIPAMTHCDPGWTMQYTGYLMSSYYLYKSSSEFVCVDGNPDKEIHGENATGGNLLCFVEAMCGSLPCQAYQSGRELACVVCSK